MKIDGNLITDLAGVPARVRDLEELGYDGAISVDTNHDPFLPLALAAEHSRRVELVTAVAIALARSPMTVAYTAHDLQVLARGRLVLGLGSQVKAHVEKRFSMPWSAPAPRLREYVRALRAIWRAWDEGEPLQFRGEHYRHVLMTPMFSPPPSPFGPPRVFLGALGDGMCEVAGEVADGVLLHPFGTARYLRERQLPAVTRGLVRGGRERATFEVGISPFVVTGPDEATMAAMRDAVRLQIAFYGSTPAYRSVLELHGWGAAQDDLNGLARRGRWAEMAGVVTDEMLAAFAVEAPLDRLAPALGERYAGLADRMSFHAPWDGRRDRWPALLAEVRAATAASGPTTPPAAPPP
jgi:probable F420-dependent oxidoreductase